MIQLTPHMRILVAMEPFDFRAGIDRLCWVCREALAADPFSGAVFAFRNRRRTSIKVLAYDGQGFWLCQKRLSKAKFQYWPTAGSEGCRSRQLFAYQLQVLLAGGDPDATYASPQWRSVIAAPPPNPP